MAKGKGTGVHGTDSERDTVGGTAKQRTREPWRGDSLTYTVHIHDADGNQVRCIRFVNDGECPKRARGIVRAVRNLLEPKMGRIEVT